MADRKVTELDALTTPNQKDFLYIVDDPTGTPASKKISLFNLFGSVPANTSITGTLTVSGNTTLSGAITTVTQGVITLATETTAATSNAVAVLGRSDGQGSIFWDDTYIYVATSNTVIKRVALSTF
jgi:hypothetical protein